jgi:phosphotransacetylase
VALQFLARSPELSLEPDLDLDALLQAWKEDGTGPAGRELANVLIFPDRAACSLGYRLVRHLGGAAVRGPLLLGLTHPVASLSRGATPDDIVEVVAMVALQAPPT